ncbi:phospholipid phosphatase 2-like isoform X1 [Sinocyclocheilus grahami]|uniref:phospholipid phosphatase 2-like isoform X1 n=1 Tax=Sinocyclocheilus grahami TaxID=75366 RepID=UPI0007AC9D7D|nr:PREDICTED: phospholipid phosphatase 2-like isoform X1 [Sinocyclocheilus grahami]
MPELKKNKLFMVLMDVMCVLVVAMPFIIMTIMFRPYQRGIYCNDETIRYPYRLDTISHKMMAAVTISCSIIIITSGEAYLVYTKRLYSNSNFNQYAAALYKVVGTFLFGACVSQSLTDMAKYTIGRLRPNFMAVCAPEVCEGYMLEINCTGNPHNVTESRLSFYSGHSSFGMYCMLFLALYVQARMAFKWARLLRPTIQFFLVAFAIYVGYTRVSDYKHHWSDVVVGLLQGALIAVLTCSTNLQAALGLSPLRHRCDTSLTSLKSAPLVARMLKMLKTKTANASPAFRSQTRTETITPTAGLYEPDL